MAVVLESIGTGQVRVFFEGYGALFDVVAKQPAIVSGLTWRVGVRAE
jgi:hypothetical protein